MRKCSEPRLSDESSGGKGFARTMEAPDREVGVCTELWSSVGVRQFTSIDKAHWMPGEPGPVDDREIAAFAMTAASVKKRAPKSLKTKRGNPYIAHRHFDCGPYPPPRRAALTGRVTAMAMALAA
jgi:hypothetical protein